MKHYTGILTLYVMNIFTITAIYIHGVRSLVIGQKKTNKNSNLLPTTTNSFKTSPPKKHFNFSFRRYIINRIEM